MLVYGEFVKRGVIHTTNFWLQGSVTQLVCDLQLWNMVAELSYHCTCKTKSFNLIVCWHMKLRLFKVTNGMHVHKIPFHQSGHILVEPPYNFSIVLSSHIMYCWPTFHNYYLYSGKTGYNYQST